MGENRVIPKPKTYERHQGLPEGKDLHLEENSCLPFETKDILAILRNAGGIDAPEIVRQTNDALIKMFACADHYVSLEKVGNDFYYLHRPKQNKGKNGEETLATILAPFNPQQLPVLQGDTFILPLGEGKKVRWEKVEIKKGKATTGEEKKEFWGRLRVESVAEDVWTKGATQLLLVPTNPYKNLSNREGLVGLYTRLVLEKLSPSGLTRDYVVTGLDFSTSFFVGSTWFVELPKVEMPVLAAAGPKKENPKPEEKPDLSFLLSPPPKPTDFARKVVETATRATETPPEKVEIVFAIDNSNSMAPAALQIIQNINQIVSDLRAKGVQNIYGALLTFHQYRGIGPIMPMQELTPEGRLEMMKRLEQIPFTVGSAPVGEGAMRSLELFLDAKAKRLVFVLTDWSGLKEDIELEPVLEDAKNVGQSRDIEVVLEEIDPYDPYGYAGYSLQNSVAIEKQKLEEDIEIEKLKSERNPSELLKVAQNRNKSSRIRVLTAELYLEIAGGDIPIRLLLKELAKDHDAEIKIKAFQLLLRVSKPWDKDLVVELALDPSMSDAGRWEAIQFLSNLQDPTLHEKITQIADAILLGNVRFVVAKFLESTGISQKEALLNLLSSYRNERLGLEIATYLAQQDVPEGVRFLLDCTLQYRDTEAAKALFDLGEKVKKELVLIAHDSHDPILQLEATQTLSRLGEKAKEELKTLIRTTCGDESVCLEAAKGLYVLGEKEGEEEIRRLAREGNSEETRKNAKDALETVKTKFHEHKQKKALAMVQNMYAQLVNIRTNIGSHLNVQSSVKAWVGYHQLLVQHHDTFKQVIQLAESSSVSEEELAPYHQALAEEEQEIRRLELFLGKLPSP